MSRLSRGSHPGRGDAAENPSRETKFSGANGDREKICFTVQLTASKIGNHNNPVDPYSARSADHRPIYIPVCLVCVHTKFYNFTIMQLMNH